MQSDRFKKYQIAYISPTAQEFVLLRRKVGWRETDLMMAEIGLENSLFHISVRDKQELIGMGRVIGDGAMFYYIQDVAIDPAYQNQGIGSVIMCEIEAFLNCEAKSGSTIALLAAKGAEQFYARYGYEARSGNPLGQGMSKFVA